MGILIKILSLYHIGAYLDNRSRYKQRWHQIAGFYVTFWKIFAFEKENVHCYFHQIMFQKVLILMIA